MNPTSFMAFQIKNDRFYESPWNLTSDPPQSCRTTFFGWGPERFDFSKFIWIGNSAQDWTSTALKIVELKKIGNSNLRNFGQNPLMLVLQMPIANAPMANGWNPLPAHISLCHCTLWSIYRLLYISFAGFQPSISWFQKWFVFFPFPDVIRTVKDFRLLVLKNFIPEDLRNVTTKKIHHGKLPKKEKVTPRFHGPWN